MRFSNFFIGPKKAKIIENIHEEVKIDHQYFSLLVLSVIIATLGLIINNSAVIIGAMILSPLIRPIVGLALATVIGDKRMFRTSISLLVVSIFVTVAVATMISLFSPLREVNSEISLRVNPTILDLIIALAAGAAAALLVSWPKFSIYTAGVAVAASVLPPICITGIGLAFDRPGVASGSFILFLTNLASIVFASILIFAIVGFYRAKDDEQRKSLEFGLMFSFVVVLALSFQLVFSLKQIIVKNDLESQTRQILKEEFDSISSDIKIDSTLLTVTFGEDPIQIESEVKVPSNISINLSQKNEIVERLNAELNREVDLELRIIPVLRVVSSEDSGTGTEKINSRVEKIVANSIERISREIEVESVQTSRAEGRPEYSVEIVLRVPEEFEFREVFKEDIFFQLINQLTAPINLDIQLIRYTRI